MGFYHLFVPLASLIDPGQGAGPRSNVPRGLLRQIGIARSRPREAVDLDTWHEGT
jgi:hypothetical protein